MLINALLHREALFMSREESRTPPVLMAKSQTPEIQYGARMENSGETMVLSRDDFLNARKTNSVPCDSEALAVLLPDMPFRHFVFVDTPGASSLENRPAIPGAATAFDQSLFVLATTLEYWPARHTISLIKEYHARFPGRFVVAANMAEQFNAKEIRRVCDRARLRLERNGITPAPPVFALSARLELARRFGEDEYRNRIKPDVRELCDCGFDAFRVMLYEFEARATIASTAYDLDNVLGSPLADAVIMNQKGLKVC